MSKLHYLGIYWDVCMLVLMSSARPYIQRHDPLLVQKHLFQQKQQQQQQREDKQKSTQESQERDDHGGVRLRVCPWKGRASGHVSASADPRLGRGCFHIRVTAAAVISQLVLPNRESHSCFEESLHIGLCFSERKALLVGDVRQRVISS